MEGEVLKDTRVTVIGGGLVGNIQALFLAKRGFQVDLYEKRQDLRLLKQVEGRSINLALSFRGREPLRELGLEDVVLESALPMSARMIHSLSGKISKQYYGVGGKSIYSVDRLALNRLLLNEAEACPNVSLHFEHQLTKADLNAKKLFFTKRAQNDSGVLENAHLEVETDFIFGCDGAFSSVRRQMMRWGRMDYNQEFIDHGYKELTLPPTSDGMYAMDETCLHIWPRGDFMMIALPNQDRSFTVTLFLPVSIFNSINTEDDLIAFFSTHFQDSIGMIGADKLVQDFFHNSTGSMVSVKCKPHFMADSTVILGDAAHAIVPFYGQGMNAGFDDCFIFYECLVQNGNDLPLAAMKYNNSHWKDCHTIADLSMYNYYEMRSLVNSTTFLIKKWLDNFVHTIFPQSFIPLYSLIAFSRVPYSEVVIRHHRQQNWMRAGLLVLTAGAVGGLLFFLYRLSGIHVPLKYRIMPCVFGCVLKEFKQGIIQ